MTRDAPRILRIKSETLNALGKASVAGGSSRRSARVVEGKLCWVRDVISRIIRERMQCLLIARERAAQHGLVNEVHSKLERMVAGHVSKVVAELIFLLIAQRGKERNRRGELVVAVSFEARHGQGRGTEGKCQREAERGIASLSQMQQAGIENKCPQPCRIEGIGVADDAVPVVIVCGQSGRR